MPGCKTTIFTLRIVIYHGTFAAIGKQKGHKGAKETLSVVCHEGMAGQSAEEITSAYFTAVTHPMESDVKHAVIWADNCPE